MARSGPQMHVHERKRFVTDSTAHLVLCAVQLSRKGIEIQAWAVAIGGDARAMLGCQVLRPAKFHGAGAVAMPPLAGGVALHAGVMAALSSAEENTNQLVLARNIHRKARTQPRVVILA